jgi:hypothetical protein
MAENGSITVKLKVEVDAESLDAAVKLIADRLNGSQGPGDAPVVQLHIDGTTVARAVIKSGEFQELGNRIANSIMHGARRH